MTLSRRAVRSAVGNWIVEGDDDALTRIYLPGEGTTSPKAPASRCVEDAAKQLTEYFAGRRRDFEVDLHAVGTPFQQDVWLALAAIPYGEVRSYGDIAIEIGRPHAFRAVGNANARNPWPIVVPCHRVVASNGIGGYAGGLSVKRYLLEIEGVTID